MVRNSQRAKRRGWITSASAGAEVSVGSTPTRIVISWDDSGDKADDDGLLLEHEPLAGA